MRKKTCPGSVDHCFPSFLLSARNALFVKEDRLSAVLIKKINAMPTFVFSVGIR